MAQTTIFCEHCGRANSSETRFCASCGHQLGVYQSMASSQTGSLSGATLLKERYRILSKLGQGGFGAVYLAEDTLLADAPRAIKEMSMRALSEQEAPQAIAAFKQEAELLASMMHPHLPRVYDHFAEQERWYLIMDYVDGETLEKRLEKAPGGRLSLDDTLHLALQLCTVLGYLHSRQPPIIFRDLKPANIMLTADNHLYLIDFGIARLFKPGQAKDTVSLGSPGYAAPEQFGRAQTTAQSDIYSLGATLHHLLSGRDPGDDPFNFPPLDTDRLGPKGPPLAALIERMTALRREQRPASMQDVRDELERIVAGKASMPTATPRTPLVSMHAPSPALPPSSLPEPKYTLVVARYGGNFTSLAAAARAAYPGTRILVKPGTYLENVVVDKEIEFVGDGPSHSIIVGSRTDGNATFTMQADRAWIRGITISVDARNTCALEIRYGQPVIADCNITAMRQAFSVDIHGRNADPLLLNCLIHQGAGVGVLVREHARATLEACQILGNGGPGVAIEQGGKPTLRRCQIFNGRNTGVFVRYGGEGLLENCEIANNAGSNIIIASEGKPLFKRCKISYDRSNVHGTISNVYVRNHGEGVLEECEISGNSTVGVRTTTGGSPTLRNCTISSAQTHGVQADEGGNGQFEGCAITENAQSGVKIGARSWLTLQDCKIYRNGQYGVEVSYASGGRLDGCEIFEHESRSINPASGHGLMIQDCQIA